MLHTRTSVVVVEGLPCPIRVGVRAPFTSGWGELNIVVVSRTAAVTKYRQSVTTHRLNLTQHRASVTTYR